MNRAGWCGSVAAGFPRRKQTPHFPTETSLLRKQYGSSFFSILSSSQTTQQQQQRMRSILLKFQLHREKTMRIRSSRTKKRWSKRTETSELIHALLPTVFPSLFHLPFFPHYFRCRFMLQCLSTLKPLSAVCLFFFWSFVYQIPLFQIPLPTPSPPSLPSSRPEVPGRDAVAGCPLIVICRNECMKSYDFRAQKLSHKIMHVHSATRIQMTSRAKKTKHLRNSATYKNYGEKRTQDENLSTHSKSTYKDVNQYDSVFRLWSSYTWLVDLSVGALSPDNHKGLNRGWNQTLIHLLPIPHKTHETAKFFKIHKICLETNIKQDIQTLNTNFRRSSWSNVWTFVWFRLSMPDY